MLDKGVLYDDARREFEKMFIARALQRSKGNVGDAAELLGLHRNTIARKITEYRIKRSDVRKPRRDSGLDRIPDRESRIPVRDSEELALYGLGLLDTSRPSYIISSRSC